MNHARQRSRAPAHRQCAGVLGLPIGVIVMSFKYSYTFPCNGPNKLPRFSQWAADNLPGIEFSLPPQVPAKSTTLTVRLKSAEDRQALVEMLEGATF